MKLRDHAKDLGLEVGCSDSGCIWGAPSGMCTNGGCRCLPATRDPEATLQAKAQAYAFASVAQHLAAEVERYDLVDRGKTRDINLLTEEECRVRPVVEAATRRRSAVANTDDMTPARPDSTLLVEIIQPSGDGMAVYETTTGDLEVETILDDGARDVFITIDGATDEKDVVLGLLDEIHRLRAQLPDAHDRAALKTAAFELKERRNNHAAELERYKRAGSDPFVIGAYEDGVKECNAAIAVCERLAKGGA